MLNLIIHQENKCKLKVQYGTTVYLGGLKKKKNHNTKCSQGCDATRTFMLYGWVGRGMGGSLSNPFGKLFGVTETKATLAPSRWPSNSNAKCTSIRNAPHYSPKATYQKIPGSATCNSSQLEKTQMPINKDSVNQLWCIHTVEYHAAIERNIPLVTYRIMGKSQNHAAWKKADTIHTSDLSGVIYRNFRNRQN